MRSFYQSRIEWSQRHAKLEVERQMRIVVIGDPYCPSEQLRGAFACLEDGHVVSFADVLDEPGWVPSTPSELRIGEVTGSPAQVMPACRCGSKS
jgi:hypothetical protein